MLESAFTLPSLVEDERKQLLSQRKKAYSLIFLMIMLAQTSYIGALEGWSYPTKLDEPSFERRSPALENLFPDLDLRLFVDPSNSSSYSGSGMTLVDLSSYDHNGTIDGATWEADRTRFSYDGSCTTGSVANFDCDEINFGESNDHDPDSGGDWSVSAWFNASTIQQSVIVGKVDDGGASVDVGWMIRMNSNGVQVDVGTTGNSSVARTSNEAIATDRWYHVVLVASKGASLAMFIDGVEVENTSLASSGDLRNTGNGVSIGSYNAGEYSQPFDGQIGAVMAYADALNLTAVNQLYNASKGVYSNSTALSYSPENMTLEKGTTMTTNTPSVSGGAVTSWEIDPSLPSGLSFGSTNGSIWGTPTILQTTAATYTIWANNSGGSTSAQVNITINDQIASISYSSPVEISNNRPLASTITPTTSGGAITSWEITPALPTGLTFGTSNGSIWGTPENVTSNATYTIYANNSGGSASATLTLNMNWTLTPSVDGAYITRNSSIGTDITWEWDYDPLEASNLTMYASWRNTCAIRDDGDVYCWGRNGNGQLGIGSSGSGTWKDSPTKTNNLGSDAVSLSMGEQHVCAVLDTGVLECWGRNNFGQIGTGSSGDVKTPTTISVGSGRTVTSVYLGFHHTCAILDDQSVKCWGRNEDGELGVGSTTTSFNTPQTINSLGTNRHAISLALGEGFTCALLDDGSIKCWGQDNEGQRGDGGGYGSDIRSPPSSAITLPAGRTATQITAGQFHVCALLDDASVVCWGKNANGQLGDGSTSDRTAPVATSSFGTGHSVSFVSAGYDHTCALLTDGGVRCWGYNNKGQLGDGTSNDRSTPPSTDVNLGSGYTAIGISSGGVHTCAMLQDGDMKCWGSQNSGQLGDNSNFASSYKTTPVFVQGTRVWQEGEFLTSPDVSGATCGISPALPTGMSLTSGTCAITGTPTVTAVNATYTVWANISGQSFSGQVWLEVGLNVPIVSYSPSLYTYTKDTTISTIVPTNTGGEVTTWAINGSLPSGLSFGTSNGSIWGTPDTITASTTYTVWANNSAGSGSTTITLTVNDVAPSITFTPSSLILATGAAMTPITASNSGGSIVSCSVSPSLPSGLSLSNTCTLSGTPTVASSAATYTITATNTGGSDTATFSLTVQASGGTLTISPTSREGSVNSALANITMSYTHTASNYGWTSGVSNTTTSLATNFDYGSGVHWLGADSGEQGELVVVYARKDSTTITHSLAMLYRWNGTWTETILDNGTNTGHHPSVAIDRQGAIHIAYIDDNNDKLRYATNASGSWVFATLGNSTIDLDSGGIPRDGRGTAIVVHPITDAVHIVATNYVNSSRGLSYHTNEGGSWVNETITDMTKDEGHDPAMAMDADGNLHVAHYCSTSCNDLRLSSRIDGVWQNETVSSSGDIGRNPDIAIDSQGTIHIVSKYESNGGKIHLHSGTPGSWTAQTGLSGIYAMRPVVEVDSNDAVHIAYHYSWTYKDVMYMTNASGSWSTPSKVEEWGGWDSVMVIDANDDIFIPNIHTSSGTYDDELQLTTVQGYGQGLTARPIFDISPMLPDGLVMNWRNGTISGTPTEALANTSFTVTVTALGANTTGTFTLFITGEPGIIAYTDIQATNRTVITTATPSFTNNSTSGTTTSWAISPSLPSGLSFGTTNGSIWGTPTLEQIKTSYTVWANNTAGSSSTTINITIGPAAPGDFEYIPEDNVLFNTTYAHLAPSFVNITTGNGTTWQVGSSDTGPGSNFAFNINGVVYFDAGSNEKLWAYSPGNNSTWKISNTVTWVGEHMAHVVEDTIYFSGHTSGTGREFYAYTTTNQTLWLVSDIRSGSTSSEPGNGGSAQDGDVLFFMAYSGTTTKWFSYNHSNGTLTSKYVYASSGGTAEAIGDTLYFRGRLSSSDHAEMLAYSAVNATIWMIEDIYSGSQTYGTEAGYYLHTVVNDVLLFDAWDGVPGPRGIWAYNPANATAWELQSADSALGDSHVSISSTSCGQPLVVGDVAYFCATGGSNAGGYELWAYNTSNETTWLVTDIQQPGDSHPGQHMFEVLGDTLYFSAADGSTGIEMWAYDTSNHTTWRVADINSGSFHSNPGQYMTVVVGDTLYFSAKTEATNQELFAYDTSNQSLWLVEDLRAGSQSSFVGEKMALVAGNKLMFNAKPSGTTSYLYGHEPSEINWMTNTGGNVATWAINNTNLPTGLTFSTSNGTIYGTPTQLWSKTAYMVWANNSGGSSVGYLNITVMDANLSYSKYDLTLTKDQASNDLPLNATTTAPGTVTTWAISSTLPAGLNFGTSNGTIWGIPTVLQTTATTYTIWANGTHGSVSASLTLAIYDNAPGPFEYNPENNTLTNNTYVHLEPDFINITTGNGSSWSTPAGTFMPWASSCLHHVDNGTLYTAATNGTGASPTFYGYGLDNETAWVINSSIFAPGCYKFIGYGGMTSWHGAFSMAYGTSLYFEASEGNWDGLFGYGLENGTVWRETSDELEITSQFTAVVDDVLYFGAYHNSSVGHAMHGHNLSNGTTWLVLNASNGNAIQTHWTYTGGGRASVVGDVFFYYTYINSNFVYWAYNTSNGSAWAISSEASSGGGPVLDGVFYYTSGSYYDSRALYAYNDSNETSWLVHTRWGLNDIHEMDGVLYYGARSTTNSYTSLWAHNPDNGTTWEIGGTSQSNYFGFLDAGGTLFYRVHSGTSNERDLWAYEPSNATAWQVTSVPLNGDTFTSLGNTVYFTSESTTISGEHDLWAYNTANETTWFVTNISATNWGFTNSGSVHHPDSTSLIFAGDTLYIREGGGMRSHQPASINYQTNTGGNVTTWAINASLPSGLSFGTNNGTIYGTPTELWTQTSYMVWANNSGGSSVAYLNITVVDELPTLSYSPSTLVLTINNQSSDLPLNATLTGSGTITSWAISPALPSGLSFGTGNGTIWGTPTSLMTLKTFTIWANNSGGSSSATVNITVNDEAPDISYNPDWFVLTNNTAMSPTATPTNSGGAIPSGIIDSNGYVGAYTSIAIDSNGYKHVSYRDSIGLRYATDASGSWVTTPVDTSGIVGGYTSIAIDSDDAVHISYYDYSNKDLKYATCSSGCTTASNWDIVSIDTSGSVGTYTSIAIDSNDAVHISYHKGYTDYDLKYASCSSGCTTASNWDLVSVATTGLVGYHTSIAIDSNDAIHISYGDSSNGYLKYATCSSGCTSASNWNTVSIDTNSGGYDTSITIDSNDTVHISYRDGANADLEYATCSTGCTSASNWNLVSVDTTGYVGYASSIGVDSNNAVHISYYDSINDDLKYATCSSGCTSASNWNDRSLDTMGDVGSYTSIAIDSNDAIHISYFDGTNADLKYVTLDSSSNLYGYSISPDLPEGLELNVNTGEISGTPTELSTNTTYTITARNSGGVNTTTITIEVIDNVPTVSYSPENLTLTNNTASSNLPLAPTITGSGAITSWALNNTSLPSGISFSTSTGTFSGTPTELWPTQAYMVWANNSGGSTVAYLNITVVDQLPTLISYSPNDLNLTNNTGFTPPTIIVLGSGTIASWELNNTLLPTGVLFGTNNGTIYGTPTELWNRTAYMVWANNSGGSTVAYLNITVIDEVPTLSYSPTNLNLTNNTVSSDLPLVPTVTGSGTITSWAINASLPSGLYFGTNNGTLYGTPTELWYQTAYMVWANNSGGSTVAYLNITVVDQLPTVAYSPANIILTNNTVSSDLPLVPIVTGQGEITLWGLNTSLPSGLSFDNNNGTIWGTPTELWPTTAYRLIALNSGGTTYAYFNLTVIDQLPTSVTYTPENLTLTRGEVSSNLPLVPALTGSGDITSWAINASLPTGLSFGTNNGTIWGLPQVNMTTTEYTVWANNSGGSVSTTLNITVLEPIVVLDYNPENLTLVRSIAMTDLHPTVTGGSVETWEIHPSIPAGLNFADGVLSGTPMVNMTLTMFTIYANTTGGSASHTINLTILEPGVILEYNPENQTMTRGVAMVTMTPTVTNGTAETWSIDPLLPSGLNFNNGVISGTPTVNMTRTMFTVWANTTGGATFHTINLTILEPIVGLDYNPENLTLTRGVAMTDLHPIVTGGNVSEWGISPIPLSGLTFAEGLLYGTPGINQTTPIMYTIYANTTGGSITHAINITVLEPVVDLFYNPENQTFIRTEQTIAWSPTVSDGLPETWAIEPALPNGLVFDNGTISGSPTVNLTTTQYTVWANNSGGSASTSINITINEPAPEIEYVPSDLVLTRGTAMTTLQPNVTGGSIETWEIEPAIPNGLSFVGGVISGTPTAIQNQTQYVVWANNSGGSLMAYLNITILDIVPEIAYTPENMTLTNDTSVVDWLPVNIGGPALTWSISPALSEGLEFNETTGHITGTPTEVMDVRTYVVTAFNSGGFASTQINITVLDQVPIVAYVPDDVVLLNNSTVLTMEAISTGGVVTSWSILPDPSPGLLFDTTNGTLSGVATQVQNRTMYEITASNDVGSITVYVNVTVEDLFYNMSLGPLYLLNNSEMVALEPELVISGSTFEIEPDLPEGLFFGADNGTIWGTPTELMDLTNFTIYANSSLFNDEFVVQIGVLEDTDLDGLPNELPEDADPRRGLVEDLDDDGDGYTDVIEGDCLSDPLDGSDVPADLDRDFICNAIDDDIDGDGLNNTVETNTSVYVDANNTGTDPWDADTDGDGVCDGPIAPALPADYCEAGPDAFPNDAAAYLDTDGDGMPDELWGESTTGLIEDVDDDNDGWTDLDEAECGPTDSKNEFDMPVDSDGDGICDFNEVLSVTYGTGDFELLQGERNVTLQPIITGMTVDIWEISPALPYGLFFGGDTMARTSNGNGTVYGVPLVPSNLTEYTVTATNLLTGTQISTTFNLSVEEDYDLDGLPNNNTRLGLLEVDMDDDGDGFNDTFELECGGDPYNRSSVPKIEADGTCYNYRSYEEPPEKDKNPFKPICFPIIFLVLAFLLVVPMILTRRKQRVGVQAEHVSATPEFQSGSGTALDPFVLKAVTIPYNTKTKTEERIRCAEMSPGYEVKVRETNVEVNKKRFGAVQFAGVQDGTGVIKSNSDGLLMIQFTFDGTLEPSEFGMVYKSELILDEKTYFVWHVETKAKKGN